jgi:acyl-CoA thioesterase-1
MLPPLPGLGNAVSAKLLATDVEEFEFGRERMNDEVCATARRLQCDSALAAMVDALHIPSGSTIIGLGDSITGESQSWFEILRALLAVRRPESRLNILCWYSWRDACAHIFSPARIVGP